MHRFFWPFVICMGSPVFADASQPISESFVDCAQLYDTLNRAKPVRRKAENGAMLDYAVSQLVLGARSEAGAEGRRHIDAYLNEMAGSKAEKWDAKGLGYFMTGDARDWFAYCRSLARDRGIALKP